MKKKLLLMICVIGMMGFLFGCGSGSEAEPEATEAQAEEQTAEVEIDYGASEIYTQEDMDAAIAVIEAEFANWEGCELYNIRYASDKATKKKNLKWMNKLGKAQGVDGKFTQCIEFLSDFHSPVDPPEDSAWDPDTDYTDYQWWLARTKGGDWQLMSFGY